MEPRSAGLGPAFGWPADGRPRFIPGTASNRRAACGKPRPWTTCPRCDWYCVALIIDGYNLLHASGVSGAGAGRGQFARSRLALLNFLVESLPPDELQRTTVVFDAAGAPAGLPHVLYHRGLTVRFAASYDDADALIEELIAADTSPRRLTVSSDHRLQRAAARRRARSVDSDRWYAETLRRGRARTRPAPPRQPLSDKPLLSAADEEIAYWLKQFREVLQEELTPGGPASTTHSPATPPCDVPAPNASQTPGGGAKRSRRRPAKPSRQPPRIDEGPIFPPGYGEI